ncbi:MAG: polysaccharide deacetylase family protein [Marinifilaceae bacterium]
MAQIRPSKLIRSLLPPMIWRYPDEKKVAYLSFDDGPIPESTPWTLALLREKGVKATFFCVGDNVRKYPELYQKILEEGHAVGNHTFNHLNGWKTSTPVYLENVEKATNLMPTSLFRPPYGMIRPAQARVLRQDYRLIMWDVLSGDYLQRITPEQCLQRVLRGVRPGSVIVFHNHIKSEANMRYALPRAIDELRKRGYQFGRCY